MMSPDAFLAVSPVLSILMSGTFLLILSKNCLLIISRPLPVSASALTSIPSISILKCFPLSPVIVVPVDIVLTE